MSRRRRRSEEQAGDLFETQTNTSLQDVADAGYGKVAFEGERSTVTARPVSIFEVYPDPGQPRRVIPSALRESWDGEPASIGDLLTRWWHQSEQESGINLDLIAYLSGSEDTGRWPDQQTDHLPRVGEQQEPSLPENSFLRLVELAASIRRDGLTNPITVARSGPQFVIETGERRWLAYHLLHQVFGPDDVTDTGKTHDWSRIPARVVGQVDVWRQASENNARTDLNAIARARQLALLLMDVHGPERFQPLSAVDHEQDFYAQVANSEDWRIPRGQGERILQAMGFQHRSAVSRCRALLSLPRGVWEYGDDHNIAEDYLLKVSRMDEASALTYLRNVASRNISPATDRTKATSPNANAMDNLLKSAARMQRAAERQARKKDPAARAQLRALAEDQMAWWRQLLDTLDS